MKCTATILLTGLVLAASLSGCGRLRADLPPEPPPAATSTPAAETSVDAATDELDAALAAIDRVDDDAATGEQAENTVDAP